MRCGALLLACLAAVLLRPAIAATPPDGDYLYCPVPAPDMQPWSIVRTIKRDGSFAFQSSMGGLVPGGDRDFRAHLAWPDGAAQPPQLWIVQYRKAPERSVLAFSAGDGPAIRMGSEREKNALQIFDVDPWALLRQFPDARIVEFTMLRADGPKAGSKISRSSIDLRALRGQLELAAKLSAKAPPPSTCVTKVAKLPVETDIAEYTLCPARLENALGEFSFDMADGPSWTRRFTSALVLGIHAREGSAKLADIMAARDRLLAPGGPMRVFRYNNAAYESRSGVTFGFSAGTESYSMPLRESWQLDIGRLSALSAIGTPIEVWARDRNGKLLDSGVLPAGFVNQLKAGFENVIAQRLRLLEDPLHNCAPLGADEYDFGIIAGGDTRLRA